jgi:hypothetical protein
MAQKDAHSPGHCTIRANTRFSLKSVPVRRNTPRITLTPLDRHITLRYAKYADNIGVFRGGRMPTDHEEAQPRLGRDLLFPSQVAEFAHVNESTVIRWIKKPANALPAMRVTANELRALGFQGNLYQNDTFYLVRSSDLVLIEQVRKYPKGTKRPNRKSQT